MEEEEKEIPIIRNKSPGFLDRRLEIDGKEIVKNFRDMTTVITDDCFEDKETYTIYCRNKDNKFVPSTGEPTVILDVYGFKDGKTAIEYVKSNDQYITWDDYVKSSYGFAEEHAQSVSFEQPSKIPEISTPKFRDKKTRTVYIRFEGKFIRWSSCRDDNFKYKYCSVVDPIVELDDCFKDAETQIKYIRGADDNFESC